MTNSVKGVVLAVWRKVREKDRVGFARRWIRINDAEGLNRRD